MPVTDPVKAIVVVLVVLIALFFGFCCHFASKNRRDEEENIRAASTQRTSVNTNRNNASTVYVFGLRGGPSNSNSRASTEDQLPDDEVQSPDPIADSGPPSYRCSTSTASGEPLPPPPSYEDALRISCEHLAVTQQQHQDDINMKQ